MKLLSVNVGRPRPNPWNGLSATGIDKQPVNGPVPVTAPGPKGTGEVGLLGDGGVVRADPLWHLPGHAAARELEMTPPLWRAWGEDWRAKGTPASVHWTVAPDLSGGGTILPHDSNCTATPDSWRSTLGAVPKLLDHCVDQKLAVGPLRERY